MNIIKIKSNRNGDSRVADHIPTIEEFEEANLYHIQDVKQIMGEFAQEIRSRSEKHDRTKIIEPYRSMFYRDLCNTIEGRIEFLDGEWSRLHYAELERHHLNMFCPEDVNLIDVIEMLCDCVVAGKARAEQETAKVEAETKLIKAQNDAAIEVTKAEAEAEANEKLAASITPELIAMKEAEARLKHGWVTVQGANNVVTKEEGN